MSMMSCMRAAALLTAVAWTVGCGDAEKPAPPPREVTETPPPTPTLPTPTPPAPTPPPEPVATGGGDPTAGAGLYTTYCATCHGPRGEGDGPLSGTLTPKPAKHSDGAYMNALNDEHLFKVIKEGGSAVGKSPLMAAWGGSLNDAQIRDVIAFVRSLADPPYKP